MKKSALFTMVIALVVLTSCRSSDKIIIPTTKTLPTTSDNYTIIWLGSGKSYVYIDGKYQRNEANDYAFEVVQRRYGNSWKSVKNLHRLHPDYDGIAGPREQTLFFGIDFSKNKSLLLSKIKSSLGSGNGYSDFEFRKQQMQFSVDDISSFAPYNMMRITQDYQYENGGLLETVELYKLKNGIETPFAKIEERAEIFRPKKLNKAPTKFQ